MAIKKINRIAKIELIGGQAKPGPALASIGINMGEFTKQFNDKTKDRNGEIVPTIITAFTDKSFSFEIKTTPVTVLLKKAANLEKGSSNPKDTKVATITQQQALEIAKYKLVDTNANDEQAVLRMVAGTAKQMGIEIENFSPYKDKNKK